MRTAHLLFFRCYGAEIHSVFNREEEELLSGAQEIIYQTGLKRNRQQNCKRLIKIDLNEMKIT